MDPLPTSTIRTQDGPGAVLATLGREGERGRRLRSQLKASFADRHEQEIEDAVQNACRSFLAEAHGITEPGAVYKWIRTAAHRALLREVERQGRERPVDPVELVRSEELVEADGPAEELIALEEEAELSVLVREVAGSLSERRRRILALWAVGRTRPEIASRLGIGERAVKRDLLAIMEEARAVLARAEGGGCLAGEPLVLRLLCGLSDAAEAARARAHIGRCGRCAGLAERLEAWREKAGAILPLPAAEVASPGLLGRVAEHGAHAIGSLRRHVLGGGPVRGRVSPGGSCVPPAVDPSPLAAIRPGAVAAVVAGCLAVGGGATYCAREGVDPIGAAEGLIAGTQEGEPSPPATAGGPPSVATPVGPVEEAPVYQPGEPTGTEATYAPEPESEPEPEAKVESKAEPEPEPEVEPEPEASFEPSAPVATTATGGEEAVAEPATESAPVVKEKPAAAPGGDAPQFGGP